MDDQPLGERSYPFLMSKDKLIVLLSSTDLLCC
jgi:hypothetical protein